VVRDGVAVAREVRVIERVARSGIVGDGLAAGSGLEQATIRLASPSSRSARMSRGRTGRPC
jgi:hypothetical protein